MLGGLFGLTLFVFWPIANVPPLIFAFVYVALAATGMFFWHHKNSPETPLKWLLWAGGSVLAGAVFFAIDILIGHFSYPDLALLEAGTKAGGMFGFLATLVICPGGTFICMAGWARSLIVVLLLRR